jgi:hypothetical protein
MSIRREDGQSYEESCFSIGDSCCEAEAYLGHMISTCLQFIRRLCGEEGRVTMIVMIWI